MPYQHPLPRAGIPPVELTRSGVAPIDLGASGYLLWLLADRRRQALYRKALSHLTRIPPPRHPPRQGEPGEANPNTYTTTGAGSGAGA